MMYVSLCVNISIGHFSVHLFAQFVEVLSWEQYSFNMTVLHICVHWLLVERVIFQICL